MTTASTRIIFVDDELPILNSLKRVTRALNAECLFLTSAKDALQLMEEEPADVVVSDMRMPEMNGATFLAEVATKYPETMRLVLTGYSEEALIMSAINEGRIWGFITKPWEENQLLSTLQQAMSTQQMMAERALLRRTVERFSRNHKKGFMGFIGESLAMQIVYNAIERAAPSDASVFITGPSGTGKEVAAAAIHKLSQRKHGPFVPLNCAAIPKDLMESEIFGHVKGAFSGAVSNRDGAATQANGGTLFLDELGEMDISLQAKLLRFIQTGTIQKVGSNKSESVDIRFICATNRPPLEAIAESLLREDLYYRLNVIPIAMPPLAQREDDPLALARFFLDKFAEKENKVFAGFTQNAEKLLLAYSWPGNVRQLENCIHSLAVMNEGPMLTEDMIAQGLQLDKAQLSQLLNQIDLPSEKTPSNRESQTLEIPNSTVLQPLSEVERAYIEKAIDICGGNVVKAASALAVSPSTLYRKMQSWENTKT